MAELHEASRDLQAAETDGRRPVVTALPSGHWRFPRTPGERVKRPGSRMIGIATVLLFVLGTGLLGVSLAAQYAYVDAQRHQHVASLIEAGALDVGMVIFALLALGLARAGQPAKVARACVVVCAAGSAVMNYAAADVSSPRSVLAFIMPPLFLALVVDQVVVTVRRHVLGMTDDSPWAEFARSVGRALLWAFRFVNYPGDTWAGVRRMVLAATPLPAPAPKRAITGGSGSVSGGNSSEAPRAGNSRSGSKKSRFIDLVIERHGPLAEIPLDRVSPICTELAGEVDYDPGTARTELGKAIRAAPEQ